MSADEDMGLEEQTIAQEYRREGWWVFAFTALCLGIAMYYELRAGIAAIGIFVLMSLGIIERRLYDLCVRVRRTNLLLRELLKNANNE